MKFAKSNLQQINIFAFLLNIANIFSGILYIFIGLNTFLLFIFSGFLIIGWFTNVFLLLINDHKTAKNSKPGVLINILSYMYLIFQIIFILMIAGGLFLLNADWASKPIQYLLIYTGFFGYFIYGCIVSFLTINQLKREGN
ncbi:MAG: membrane protein of unknown function [Promethearchaeota archaeon]|nr:MAG: membrane protein of unknown function [Candidatus Lokiarchaeota archaeon]